MVTGKVIPVFPEEFPEYMKNCVMYQLEKFDKEFEWIEGVDANTTLYKRELFELREVPFDPEYGLTGGGDKEFAMFLRQHDKRFLKTNRVIVYERQPLLRAKWSYQWNRQFRGTVNLSRVVRKYCGREVTLQWTCRGLLNTFCEFYKGIPRLFYEPKFGFFSLVGTFIGGLALISGLLGIKKKGY